MIQTPLIFLFTFCVYPAFAQTKVASRSTSASTTADAPSVSALTSQGPLDYVCPMDPDVRSDKPGVCSRCGMALHLGIPDQIEYPLDLTTIPVAPRAMEKVHLTFNIRDPKNGATVKQFQIVHEKLFHMFIVSRDLKYFLHDHPTFQPDGTFAFDEIFPKPGMYRIVADVYPTSGMPQLIVRTVFIAAGPGQPVSFSDASLEPSAQMQHGENTDVEITTSPAKPIAGVKTLLFLKLKPAVGMQKYLGAWAHMLVASEDTIDLIHEHPFIADGGEGMQFNLIFPRARTYRIWVQFQRRGVVNTIAFNVPVLDLVRAAEQGISPN